MRLSTRAAAVPLLTIAKLFPFRGAPQTALDLFLDRFPGRMFYGRNKMKPKSAVTHLQVGEITAKIDAANLIVQRAAEDLDRNAEAASEYMPMLDRARVRRDVGFAIRLLTEAADTITSAYGGSAAWAANAL